MSEVKVNKISPRTNCGTVQLGDSGDTITIPAGATIVNNGTQTGFGRTGTVDWDTTAKTASFTAVSGNGYFVNTTSGAITVTLPAGSAGDIISLADYAATWQTNAVTVTPNGTDKIGGVNANLSLGTEGQSVTFVYADSTQGWLNTMDSTSNARASDFIIATGGTVTTCGNCKIHTFTGPGTFTVSSSSGTPANNIVSYMVVAGGGGGGRGCSGGGGGAGGFREYKSPVSCYTASPLDGNPGGTAISIAATAYPITVGGGGAGPGPGTTCIAGCSGSNSVFSTVTSTGGGYGGGYQVSPTGPGGPGGSGGGGAHNGGTGGLGNTPPVSPSQGNNGATSQPATGPAPSDAGAGGGGATAVGTPNAVDHTGGAGATTSISGTPTTYAGGGGGTNRCGGDISDTAGGSGGGGGGSYGARPKPLDQATGDNGTSNTGGGGGGGGRVYSTTPAEKGGGGTGGSGIVIIRYKYQ
jgi:hypothetical protein